MEVESFTEIADEFAARTARLVWCTAATVDRRDRTRMRVLHPIWEGHEGWVWTRRDSLKAKHLARNPHLSLCYLDLADPSRGLDLVYVDCRASWDDSAASRERIWQLFASTPPPLGYDPGTILKATDDPEYGLLRLSPWRIELGLFDAAVGPSALVWRSPSG